MYEKLEEIPYTTFYLVIFLSLIGGIYNFGKNIERLTDEKINTFRAIFLILYYILISVGIGVSTFFTASHYNVNELSAIGIASFASYIGIRIIGIFEMFILARLGIHNLDSTSSKDKKE